MNTYCKCRMCTNSLLPPQPPRAQRHYITVAQLDPTWTYPYATRREVATAYRICNQQDAGELDWKSRTAKRVCRQRVNKYESWCADQERIRLKLDEAEGPRSKVLEIA